MIHNFSGTVTAKTQKKNKDGSDSDVFILTIQTKDGVLVVDGFGKRATVGATYDNISMSIGQHEWNGRLFNDLFIKSLANPSYVPDPDPSENPAMSVGFSNPAPVQNQDPYSLDGNGNDNDDLPF